MKPIKIGFDLGNNSLKIAVNRRGSLEFHECPLPENLIEEDTVTMPHAFSSFLKKVKSGLRESRSAPFKPALFAFSHRDFHR